MASTRSSAKALFAFAVLSAALLRAQDNYVIQVYSSENVARGVTLFELHNNFTIQGHRATEDGLLATARSWHETLEVTRGFTPWFESSIQILSSANTAYGWKLVGVHLRPQFIAPEKWNLPVGLGLSTEIAYQRHAFSPDPFTLELRPIVDKRLGPWYLAFNPVFSRALHGQNVTAGWAFSPSAKVSRRVYRRARLGLEYYGSLGPLVGFDALRDQEQQILPAVDIDLGPRWEFNAGVGIGVTQNTDHLIIKMIIGRKFAFGHKVPSAP